MPSSRFFVACILLAWLATSPASAQPSLVRSRLAQVDLKPVEPPAAEPVKPAPGTARAPEAAHVKPDAAAEAPTPLAIKLAAVSGAVQVRIAEDQPWQAAKVGDDLPIGAEVRTGLRSVCKFTIDGNHTITLDRLGVVKVLDAIKKDGRVKTDVGMKYGRTQYQVEPGAGLHDSRVHAPSGTLAVRGSFITLEDNDAFGCVAIVDHSEKAVYKQRAPEAPEGAMRVVEMVSGRIEQSSTDTQPPPTPAQQALTDSINDVGTRLARSGPGEERVVSHFPGLGDTALGPTIPLHDLKPPAAPGLIPGGAQLVFGGLEVSIVGQTPADIVAYFLRDPLGAVLSTNPGVPGTPFNGQTAVRPGEASGGFINFQGSQVVFRYPEAHFIGQYTLGAVLISGGPVPYSVSVTRSAQVITSFGGGISASTPANVTNFVVPLPIVGVP